MKLVCKKCCSELTKDLYLSKKFELTVRDVTLTNDNYFIEDVKSNKIDTDVEDFKSYKDIPKEKIIYQNLTYEPFKGSFVKSIYHYWNKKEYFFAVNKESVSGNCKIPKFESGNGCCNNSHIDFHCLNCKEIVGEMNYDCWQSIQAMDFYRNKVDFKYK